MEPEKRAVLICLFILLFLLASPPVSAQDDEGNGEGEDTSGVTCVFCSIIIFIVFLVFMAYQNSKRRNQEKGGYNPSVYSGQSYQQGYRYPQRRAPPQQPPPPPPQKSEVKCDLCFSKNLRFFEKGFVKCNDCRHVFHVSEGYSRRRGR